MGALGAVLNQFSTSRLNLFSQCRFRIKSGILRSVDTFLSAGLASKQNAIKPSSTRLFKCQR